MGFKFDFDFISLLDTEYPQEETRELRKRIGSRFEKFQGLDLSNSLINPLSV